MTIYILLVIYIFAVSIFCKLTIKNKELQEKWILILCWVVIFLILALKKDTVGSDIAGYAIQYNMAENMSLFNLDYIYFEPGYVFITNLFSKIISFQMFLVVIYGVSCFAWYKVLRKYSANATIGCLMFVCYDCFVFYVSGIRQLIAMSVCLFAYMLLDKRTKKGTIGFILLVLIATTIHQSAFIFAFVGIIEIFNRKQIKISIYIALIVASVFVRVFILQFINTYFLRNYVETSITLGGSFMLQIAMVGLIVFPLIVQRIKNGNMEVFGEEYLCFAKHSMTSIFLYVVLSGSVLLRATLYYRVFLILGLTRALKLYGRDSVLIKLGLCIFLPILFYTETLAINQFDLCPYLFFWQ